MSIRTCISITTLNVNRLNAPTKRHRLAEWIQKQDLYICCLQDTHLTSRDTYKLKVRGWKKIFHTNRDQKKAGVAIFITDKIDFKMKNIFRDKEGHYIMIKGSIQEEDDNNLKYLRTQHRFTTTYKATANNLKRTNQQINTIIVVDLNTPLTAMDRSS
uniref:exodeoxyribonuclease III n=1 Tax=Sus scrofa TaxID=9823 RepID=A0A8W4FH15_PIG